MANKHTPGPWRVGREIGESQLMPRIEILRDLTHVEGARPTTYYMAEVCYPTTMGNTVGAVERRANARLIAAAPDLLEALRELAEKAHNVMDVPDSVWEVIAKAEGRASPSEIPE